MTITESFDDVKQMGAVLLDCELRLKGADYSETLEDFQEEIAQQNIDLFANECSSMFEDWAPLKPSTIARKGHDRILFETGRLKTSLTVVGGPGNVNKVTQRGLLFGTDVEYSIFHQTGTSRMPARPPVGLSVQLVDELANTIADAAVNKLKVTV